MAPLGSNGSVQVTLRVDELTAVTLTFCGGNAAAQAQQEERETVDENKVFTF